MKAQILYKPSAVENRPLSFSELEKPQPKANEILLRVSACGICQTDLHVVEGELPVRRSNVIPGHQIVGKIEKIGESVTNFSIGERIGVAWLHKTCGECRYCLRKKENLCENAEFTGWTQNGGFAEYAIAPADFVYPLPENFYDLQAAPLLCAGIIGYRALKLAKLTKKEWKG
ncbi:MAG TPA: alcohol dehydrogenase catalytic domain-containing protein, partial [Pyrinomonadaceae bacterium]|nr:alcohol dehydrogenase catalytic domain-containing protein [Pyrinomonadaceae bacterium]